MLTGLRETFFKAHAFQLCEPRACGHCAACSRAACEWAPERDMLLPCSQGRGSQNLTTPQGESIPFTFLLASWTSAQVTSSVIEILASEIMGYNVAIDPQVPASSVDGIYALLGCSTWWDGISRGCEDRKVKAHVMIDSWYRLCCTHNLQEVQEKYNEEAPREGGNMGYLGDAGAYISEAPRVQAKNTSGLALEYYQSYDANWFTPSQYFSSLSSATCQESSRIMTVHFSSE